jgi:hypothetical protein
MIRRESDCHAELPRSMMQGNALQRLSHLAPGHGALCFVWRSNQNYAVA